MRRTLPIDRYYSSMSRTSIRPSAPGRPRRSSGADGVKLEQIARMPAHTFSQLLAMGLRWSGLMAIALVIIFNLVLSGVGVKVSPQQTKNLYRDDKTYVTAAQDVFSSSLLHRTKLTLDSKSVEDSLKKRLPEVENATAVVPLVGLRLQVGLRIAEPLVRVQINSTTQGVIAENGVLVLSDDITKTTSKYSNLPLLDIEPAVGSSVGQSLLTSSEVELLTLLKTEFDGSSAKRPKLDTISYAVTKREITARFNAATYYLKCTTAERDAKTQVGSALATIAQLEEQGTPPTEYIDVRVSGRVFDK